MGRIFYAVSGEGRGHASRARTLVQELQSEHEIVIYTYGHAFEMLAPCCRDSNVTVRQIPGILFHYSPSRHLDYGKTIWRGLGYARALPGLIRRLTRELEAEQPDLVISDFEPSLPRAARRCGLPFISLDHQHFLVTYDLSSLPANLRWWARMMSVGVRGCYWGQSHTVVSSFYFPKLRSGLRDVTQIGVLLRPEIRDARPENGDYLVAYLRRSAGPQVLQALAECGCEVRVYGLGKRPSAGSLHFRDISVRRFAEDLIGCRALISTAGNQLIGEALHLGKPVLAMPERGNREQEINAHFLAGSGSGMVTDLDKLTPEVLRTFLDRSGSLAARIDRHRLCGNAAALAVLDRYLPSRTRAARLPIPA